MTLAEIFLYPAEIMVRFIASLFQIHHIPNGWLIVLTGLVGFWLWVTLVKIVVAIVKRVFGF